MDKYKAVGIGLVLVSSVISGYVVTRICLVLCPLIETGFNYIKGLIS